MKNSNQINIPQTREAGDLGKPDRQEDASRMKSNI